MLGGVDALSGLTLLRRSKPGSAEIGIYFVGVPYSRCSGYFVRLPVLLAVVVPYRVMSPLFPAC